MQSYELRSAGEGAPLERMVTDHAERTPQLALKGTQRQAHSCSGLFLIHKPGSQQTGQSPHRVPSPWLRSRKPQDENCGAQPVEVRTTACECVSVTRSCPALCDLMDCSPPGSSDQGVSQAGMLQWFHFLLGGSSQPEELASPALAFFTTEPQGSLRTRSKSQSFADVATS